MTVTGGGQSFREKVERGSDAILTRCALLSSHESVLVISDTGTKELGEHLVRSAEKISSNVCHVVIEPLLMHGQAPPEEVAGKMLQYDVICGITNFSIAHSEARFRATEIGAKYLSLPDYSLELFADNSLSVDFREIVQQSVTLARALTRADKVRVTTKAGTDLSLNIAGRIGNAAPGCCFEKGIIASPPDAETNIAIVEDSAEGVLVVDGSIPCAEIGLLKSPITLTFRNGFVEKIVGDHSVAKVLEGLFDKLGNRNTRIAAELGIGLNPEARLCGKMLPDEGTLGTFHIGIGANGTIGGQNRVPFHLDHVVNKPTIKLDGSLIIENGIFEQSVDS
jgi:2,5-dihydroxypyridine 5,6-dioxygenase